MSTRPHDQWDPGLQPERTALAWRRSLLSLNLGALILAATMLQSHRFLIAVAASAVALAALFPTVVSPITGGMPRDEQLHSWPHLVRIATLVIALGVVGLMAAVAGALDLRPAWGSAG